MTVVGVATARRPSIDPSSSEARICCGCISVVDRQEITFCGTCGLRRCDHCNARLPGRAGIATCAACEGVAMHDLPRITGPVPFVFDVLQVAPEAYTAIHETGASTYMILYKMMSGDYGLADADVTAENQRVLAAKVGDVYGIYGLRPDLRVIACAEVNHGVAKLTIFLDD